MWASLSGHTAVVALLLKYGADPNKQQIVSNVYYLVHNTAVM